MVRTTVATVALSMGALLVTLLLASPVDVVARGEATTPQETLRKMKRLLREATDEEQTGHTLRGTIAQAHRLKLGLVRDYMDESIFGCEFPGVFKQLDAIDRFLDQARTADEIADVPGLPRRGLRELREDYDVSIDRAYGVAGDLVKKLTACAERGADFAREIERYIEILVEGGRKYSLKKVTMRVVENKEALLRGQKVSGCEVHGFYLRLEAIDIALDRAEAFDRYDHPGGPDVLAERRLQSLKLAKKERKALEELFRDFPCAEDEPPPPPPEPGSFIVEDRLSWFHVNGFGNPPTWECNYVTTRPAQPEAAVVDVINTPNPDTPDPNDTTQFTRTATTDSLGSAVISTEVAVPEGTTFTHQTTVTSTAGVSATDTETQTITSATTGANGECPAPTPDA